MKLSRALFKKVETFYICIPARVAKLVDALSSGGSIRKVVLVRIQSRAQMLFYFIRKAFYILIADPEIISSCLYAEYFLIEHYKYYYKAEYYPVFFLPGKFI